MTGTAAVLLAAFLCAAATDWWAVSRDNERIEHVFKPLTLVLLIGVAVAIDPSDDAVRAWFVVALIFGLAGDVFLMLPERFVQGLSAFLVGHIAYIAGLRLLGGGAVPWAIVAAGLIVAGLPLSSRIVRGAARASRALRLPVAVYTGAITVMVAAALTSGLVLAMVGALLFYGSDALIGWSRFVSNRRWMRTAIIVTYHLGQMALVLAIVP